MAQFTRTHTTNSVFVRFVRDFCWWHILQLKWSQVIRKYKTANKQNFTSSRSITWIFLHVFDTLCELITLMEPVNYRIWGSDNGSVHVNCAVLCYSTWCRLYYKSGCCLSAICSIERITELWFSIIFVHY